MNALRTWWPLAVAIATLWIALAVTARSSLRLNDGRFIYALDDAYIHMAMARNAAERGVWGVNRHEFSSSSSSPLWTAALAAWYAARGVDEAAPFVLNAALSFLLLLLVDALLRRETALAAWARALLLIGVAFLAPLPALVFGGMEHSLHALLTLAFVFWVARVLERGRSGAREAAGLAALAALMVAARYEGLFVAAAACGLLLLQRRWKLALALAAAAWAPVVAYGALSVARGWFWLPNSLLMKGNMPAGRSLAQMLFQSWQDGLFRSRELLALVVGAAALFAFRAREGAALRDRGQAALAVFVVSALLHATFARMGWLYRYEAYLIVVGLLAVAVAAQAPATQVVRAWRSWLRWKRAPELAAWALLAMFPVVAFERRYEGGLKSALLSTNDRYLEHYTQARFVGRYYDTSPLLLNDIGMIAFYTRARILDVYGLASREPVLFRRQPQGYSREDLRGWAERQKAPIAILKTEWGEVGPRVPPQWEHVMDWRLPRNIVFGDRLISFYAVNPAEAETLRRRLREFAPFVPRAIQQIWRGTGGADCD